MHRVVVVRDFSLFDLLLHGNEWVLVELGREKAEKYVFIHHVTCHCEASWDALHVLITLILSLQLQVLAVIRLIVHRPLIQAVFSIGQCASTRAVLCGGSLRVLKLIIG